MVVGVVQDLFDAVEQVGGVIACLFQFAKVSRGPNRVKERQRRCV